MAVIKYPFLIFSHFFAIIFINCPGSLGHLLIYHFYNLTPHSEGLGTHRISFSPRPSLLLPRVTKIDSLISLRSALANKKGSPGVNGPDLYAVVFSRIAPESHKSCPFFGQHFSVENDGKRQHSSPPWELSEELLI